MNLILYTGSAVLLALTVVALISWSWDTHSLPGRLFESHRQNWLIKLKQARLGERFETVPFFQVAGICVLIVATIYTAMPTLLIGVFLIAVTPAMLMKKHLKKRRIMLGDNLDSFLTALSDALVTVPNLGEALVGIVPHLESPIKDELETMLAEVRLGRSLDDAMWTMAKRARSPGLDAAVGAALLGKRTGGDLPTILRKIASTLREMDRLEGVVRAKTAEGRSQAWVMGMVPPGLVLILEQIDPDWLAPMWNTFVGWLLLGAVVVLELVATALIRKILAVDI